MGENVMDSVITESVQNTLDWADEMKDWLLRYETHIEEFCTNKEIPKPPRW